MDYRDCVEDLIGRLVGAGYEVLWIDDGDDSTEPIRTIREAVDTICSVDESWMRIEKDGDEHTLYIVLGNAKSEIVCDYSYIVPESEGSLELDILLDNFSSDWEEREKEQ